MSSRVGSGLIPTQVFVIPSCRALHAMQNYSAGLPRNAELDLGFFYPQPVALSFFSLCQPLESQVF